MKASRRGFLWAVAALVVAAKAKVVPKLMVTGRAPMGIMGLVDDGTQPQNISSIADYGNFPITRTRRITKIDHKTRTVTFE